MVESSKTQGTTRSCVLKRLDFRCANRSTVVRSEEKVYK